MFTQALLETHFTSQEWIKGRRLFAKHSIKSCAVEGDIIRGTIKSESSWNNQYLARLEYDTKRDVIRTYCNCYIGYDCKHTAALAHYYLNKYTVSSSSNHDIEDWLNQFETIKAPSFNQNKSFLYFLKENDYNADDYMRLELKSSRKKKAGDWSQSFGSENLTSYLVNSSYAQAKDIDIINDITRANNSRHQITRYDLFKQIVSTERCFWFNEYNLAKPIVLGEPIEATWQWVALENDLHTLQLTLNEDSKNIRIIKAQPLCYYDNDNNNFGKINTNTQSEFEENFLNSPVISEEKLPWVMSKLNLSLGEVAQRLPKPKTLQNIELSKPIPYLQFSSHEFEKNAGRVLLNFSYQDNLINPHDKRPFIDVTHGVTKGSSKIYRDLVFEQKVIELLTEQGFSNHSHGASYGRATPEYIMNMQGRYYWHKFIDQQLPQWQAQGWQIIFDDSFYFKQLSTDGVFQAQISQEENDHDFFSIGLNLDINGKKMPAFPILQSAIEQLPKAILLTDSESEYPHFNDNENIYIEVDDGDFITLSYQSIKPLLQQFVELFMPGALQKDGSMKLSRFQGHQTLALLDEQGVITKGEKKLRQLADKLKKFDKISPVTIPNELNAQLREYQHQGVNWLQFLREYQLAGILADDMGLGKTIQALTHLLIEKQQGRLTKPCLIIAPTSVIFNWAAEISKFTADLSYVVLNGNKRQQHFEHLNGYDLIITSYALLVKDIEVYTEYDFYYFILDEAHYIKNPKTKLYQAVVSVKSEHKLCLTGTPMENHLGEFWAQFNFLLPGFLSSHKQFTKLFKTPIEKHADHERKVLLNQRIKPFILRRTKEKIAKELPSKTEIVQLLRIEGKQAALYESVRLTMDERLKGIIAEKGLQRSQIEVLDALLKLRQVCNHPQLLPLKSAKSIKQSAKLEFLMDTLPEMIDEGRRILIFSQFTSMLSLISDELEKEQIDYIKLTGSTKNRQELVDKFQEGRVPVFLISLRAGGVGLNLTAADTVIHFDPWWNPAVENQATDRAYRIGQDKPVFVYKLIIENSIEEKIQQIQKNKAELANALLSEEVNESKLTLTDDILGALMAPLS